MNKRTRVLSTLFGALAGCLLLAGTATSQVDLMVSFSDDATENTTGVHLTPNVAPATPASFSQLRFGMRPFTLDAPGIPNPVRLESILDPILQVFTPSGERLTLPVDFQPGDLPVELLVNATGYGQGALRGSELLPLGGGASQDSVDFKVDPFPGLAGRELPAYPHFDYMMTMTEDDVVQTAIDPSRHPERLGLPYDIYVVRHRTAQQWAANNVLVDVSGAIESSTVTAGGVELNINEAWTTGLDGAAGPGLGVPYDIVFDFGQDGTLDPGDLFDGFAYDSVDNDSFDSKGDSFDEAGFYIVNDMTAAGPYSVTSKVYNGGSFRTQKTWYPTNIDDLPELPLIQIGHGNGHSYNWYDYLQRHLASYGYIVMSHQNNTMPGPEAASSTTLQNLEFFLANRNTIADGVFAGNVDVSRIMWIGHSRGGEGVARAYDRIVDGTYSPANFTREAVKLVSSIAPTDFLGTFSANPHDVPYHLLYGAADGDVCGCPNSNVAQSFHLLDRATGIRHSTYVHGADHNDFNCCGFNDFNGPPGTEIGRAEAQRVAEATYLGLAKHYFEGNIAAQDFFWRQYESLRPMSVSGSTIVVNQYRRTGVEDSPFVIDDFQSQGLTTVSSSGGAVMSDVTNLTEGRLDDGDLSFSWTGADLFNGLTYGASADSTRGSVFDWNAAGDRFIEFELIGPEQDLRDALYLSFRAAQQTRHPNTVANLGDLTFTVSLRDINGDISSIEIGAYGGGIQEPYQRTGFGAGVGWQSEYETIRIRISDFMTNGADILLKEIVAVRFDFGSTFGEAQGRLAFDDLEIYRASRNGDL